MGRFDQVEHRLDPEPADEDGRPPDGEDAEHAVDQAPAVEQRGRDQQAVVGRVVDARNWQLLSRMLRWVSITPLGCPVVPEV